MTLLRLLQGKQINTNLTGSFSGSFSGTFSGSGANLTDIPASGITGLNLSQIATGSVTASVSTGTGSFVLTSGSTNLLFVSSSGNIGIGNSNPVAKLQVRGSGTVSSSIAFRVENSNASASLIVNDAGDVYNRGVGGIDGNTFFGENVGRNSTGAGNTFIGRDAGLNNTTGLGNIFIGRFAGNDNTVGINNTIVGTSGGFRNSSGSNNVIIGRDAGFNNSSGSNNNFIGRSAGRFNVTGSDNTFLGTNAGLLISTGGNLTDASGSTFIGNDTRANANNQVNQIVIGNNAVGLGSNTAIIGNSSITRTALQGNVSLGTTGSISSRLHVRGSGATSATTALRVENFNASASLVVLDNGNVGVGTTNPTTLLDVSGSARITNGLTVTGSLTAPSITGSLFGTSSWSSNAISSSYAQTASLAPDYLPLTGGTINGSLTIQNNLTVLGSASIQYISESTLNIGTNLITVNTLTPSVRFGGLSVIDSGSSPVVSASFLYDSVQDEFIFVHRGTSTSAITSSHFVLGPETYNNLGDEIYLSANRIPKSVGNEHLNDSNISDNGSVVSINSNTQVTGSLTVSPPANTTGLTLSGYSLTGSNAQPAIDISGTWNTTGTPTLIRANVTNTASNANSLLMDLQVGGISQFSISRNSSVNIGSNQFAGIFRTNDGGTITPSGRGLRFFNNVSAQAESGFTFRSVNSPTSPTSGVQNNVTLDQSFYPTSGTAIFNQLNLNDAINQTGGANGITRGLLISPILISAADWRSIESTNGRIVLSDTYAASGSLSGSLLDLSQTWNTSGVVTGIRYNVTNTNSSTDSNLLDLQVGGTSQFRVNRLGQGFFIGSVNTNSTFNSVLGFVLNSFNHALLGSNRNLINTTNATFSPTSDSFTFTLANLGTTINQTGGANGITRGLFVNPTLTSAADWRSIENTVGNNLLNSTSGNTYIGLPTNTGTAKLQVQGSGSAQPLFLVSGSTGELISIVDSNTGSLLQIYNSSSNSVFQVNNNAEIIYGVSSSILATQYSTISATGSYQTIYNIQTGSYTGAFINYTITSASNARAGQLMSVWNSGTASYTEVTTTDIGNTSQVAFDVIMTGSLARIAVSSSLTTGWQVKTALNIL